MPTRTDLLSLVARASDLLGSTLDPSEVLWSLARLTVPSLADWSIISLVDEHGLPSDVESWHRAADSREATRAFAKHRFDGRTEKSGSLGTLATGTPFVMASGAREYAARTLRSDEAVAALEQLEIESAVVVPMLGARGVIGLITLIRGPERPPMTTAEVEVTVDLARRAAVTFGRAQSYERERSSSEVLQRSLLADPQVPDHLEVVTRYVPASDVVQIGGDWYDGFTQRDGTVVLVVGDVAGHDVAAAAMMGQLRSMLRGIAVTTGSAPAQLLTELDRAIAALGIDTSATAAVVRLGGDGDAGQTSLEYSNAGHPAPVLVHADGLVEDLGAHDIMLGVLPDDVRQEVAAVLAPGTTLLIFSDGLVERRREDIDVGHARLHAVLQRDHALPLDRLVDRVIADLVPYDHDDDVALIGVRLR